MWCKKLQAGSCGARKWLSSPRYNGEAWGRICDGSGWFRDTDEGKRIVKLRHWLSKKEVQKEFSLNVFYDQTTIHL